MFARTAGGQIVEAEKPAALTVHIDGHGGGEIANKANESSGSQELRFARIPRTVIVSEVGSRAESGPE
jgi:hypothetical protein